MILAISLTGKRAGRIAPLLSGYVDHTVGVDLELADLTIDTDDYKFLAEGTDGELARELGLWITLVINRRST